ncbi:MLO-like protein 3 isoform X2 [Quercus robur]|uniref:MLO-like protein 3 isoform X2 n=1 Tax=Quercus robur TaxID=38942 RepID=UPI0021620DF8|nr:MLO-like protein 3 isoform X2 [Quercus robur]
MASEGESTSPSLQDTPVWALAIVCFIFIYLSIFIEYLIHLLSNLLKRHRKTSLFEAVEKLKSVLMFLGFMSLILAVTQRYIAKICIPINLANSMLPCRKSASIETTKAVGFSHIGTGTFEHSLQAKDAFGDIPWLERRLTEADTTTSTGTSNSDYCGSQGKTSFISQEGILQLNNFIFVLAIMQIVYSFLTMALGRAKMRRWEAWEKETQTVEYRVANDPDRFRFTRQTTFGRRHMSSFTRISFLLWIKCFFRQFFNSVARVDYLTLRHGFISAHLAANNNYNFQKYIQRSLEDDFKVVVGISPVMWFIVVIFILVDVYGSHFYLWVSFIPLITVLTLGTKLEVIVAKMAIELKNQTHVIKGAPMVQPNDNLFWFNHPKFVLTLLHFTLFMNAFEISFFAWVTLQYGIKSCYHESPEILIIRMVLAVIVQVLCGYIILPLYALVTQMGSQFKSAALEDQTVHVIKKWYAESRDKKKRKQDLSQYGPDYLSTPSSSNRTFSSPDLSSHHHIHRVLTFSENVTHVSSEIEIVEEHQEIHQATGMDSSNNMAQIELTEATKTQN